MLSVTVATGDPLELPVDVLVVPVFKGGIEGPGTAPVLDALGLDRLPVTADFRGDIGQHLTLAAPGLAPRAVMLVGLGRMDQTGTAQLRRAAGVAARAARRAERLATTLAQVHATAAAVEAIAEGLTLGAYTDTRFTADATRASRLREAVVCVPSTLRATASEALARAAVSSRATVMARDLVNLPPDRKRPPALAERIAELAGAACEVTVYDEQALAAGGYGGLLAVGRGSSAAPRLVELSYRPDAALGSVVLVGKGITFDSGGLSLKRGTHMATMKADMAGAAAIAAACSALAELDVRLQVTALLALAENMPDGDAQRPADVVRIHGGRTVEVLDTDAEGRLVLADALDVAAERQPDAIVDLATLTGAAVAAVSQVAGAIMGNDEDLVGALRRAAEAAGEPLWPLPLWSELEHLLDTPMADLNNTGDGAGGGAIMGGLFLQRFVRGIPWAHLDIAGPAFLPAELAGGHLPPGGTGFGVRTLLRWLARRPEWGGD